MILSHALTPHTITCVCVCVFVCVCVQEREYSQRLAANYERELNQVLERQKAEMKAKELLFMDARQDLERSEYNKTLH